MQTMQRGNRAVKARAAQHRRERPIVPWYSDLRACSFCGSEEHEAPNCRAVAKMLAAEARGQALRITLLLDAAARLN